MIRADINELIFLYSTDIFEPTCPRIPSRKTYRTKQARRTMVSDTGRQLGIMFGFIGAILVAAAAYATFWNLRIKKDAIKEAARKQELVERGL